MGFRNPVTTAEDPIARDRAEEAYVAATEGIIPGTRLAADAIDGKTITGATVRTAGDGARTVMEQVDEGSGFSRGVVRMYGATGDATPGEFGVVSYNSLTGKKWAQLHAGDASDLTTTRPGISYGVQDAAAGGDEAVISFRADRASFEGAGGAAPVSVGAPKVSGDAVPLSTLDARSPARVGWFGMETWTEPGWNEGSEGGRGLRSHGFFFFQGGFAKGSSWVAGELMATLDAAHRPAYTHTLSAVVGGAFYTVKVYASGSVRVSEASSAAGTVTFSGAWPIG